jgi:hypothetical protein
MLEIRVIFIWVVVNDKNFTRDRFREETLFVQQLLVFKRIVSNETLFKTEHLTGVARIL